MDAWELLQENAHRDGIESTVVGIFLRRDGRILLLKRRADDYLPNLWEIPGGHVETGETLPDAVARELAEETGWELQSLRYVSQFDYHGEFGLSRQWNFDVMAVGSVVVHPEHSAYLWAEPADWHSLTMTPEMRQAVDDYATIQGLRS